MSCERCRCDRLHAVSMSVRLASSHQRATRTSIAELQPSDDRMLNEEQVRTRQITV